MDSYNMGPTFHNQLSEYLHGDMDRLCEGLIVKLDKKQPVCDTPYNLYCDAAALKDLSTKDGLCRGKSSKGSAPWRSRAEFTGTIKCDTPTGTQQAHSTVRPIPPRPRGHRRTRVRVFGGRSKAYYTYQS